MRKSRKITNVLFVSIELVLYVLFLYGDFTKSFDTITVKYSSIILCLLFACRLAIESTDGVIVAVALLFTAIADLFLLVLDTNYLLGVCSFVIVQMLYFARLISVFKIKVVRSVIMRILLCGIAVSVLYFINSLDALTTVTLCYFCNLLVNAVDASLAEENGKQAKIFFVGLVLFALCDICVGLHNISSYLPIRGIMPKIIKLASYGMWLFYAPSQVLITLSIGGKSNEE